MEINNITLDKNGHLKNYLQWNKALGEKLAKNDKQNLTKQHWLIIELVRKIYLETESTPPMRLLIKAIKLNIGVELATSRSLYQLFPDGPVRLACKYAGLPKPKHCM